MHRLIRVTNQRETYQLQEENHEMTETPNCYKTEANIYRNGLFLNNCQITDKEQDILRKIMV